MKNILLIFNGLIFAACTSVSVGANKDNESIESEVVEPSITTEANLPVKPLDLSVPFIATKDKSSSDYFYSEPVSGQKPSIFDLQQSGKSRTVELDGRILMTQEQEIEKRRTLDGAGIMINVRQ